MYVPPSYMIKHFRLSLDCWRTGLFGVVIGEIRVSSTGVCFVPVNMPRATSGEVRSSGIFDVLENHPPGNRREDVVDSNRLRGDNRDASVENEELKSKVSVFSSRGDKEACNLLPLVIDDIKVLEELTCSHLVFQGSGRSSSDKIQRVRHH